MEEVEEVEEVEGDDEYEEDMKEYEQSFLEEKSLNKEENHRKS